MFYLLIFFIAVFDLITKYIAKIALQEKINLIWDFFYLKYVENLWIAFSISLTWVILKIVTVIIIWVIFYYYYTEEKKKNNFVVDLSFSFILWWAFWNAYERLFNDKVIDFIWVKYFSIFNVADIFISLWILIYLYILFFDKNVRK